MAIWKVEKQMGGYHEDGS